MPASKPILVKCYEKMTTIAAKNRYWVGSPFDAGTPSVYNILEKDMQSMYLDQMTPEALAKGYRMAYLHGTPLLRSDGS